MEKIIPPDSWDFGAQTAILLPFSSRGLVGSDYGLLTKRAGEEFAHLARNIKFADGEVPLHLIAMGSTEGYGANRNGDGFREAVLKKYGETFVKNARFYRHHKNKDPSKSYGMVKLQHYNEPMRRLELLVALNGTEKAAERNGGLLADKELEKLESDKDMGVSMACNVDHDECSACGNKAASRKEYCKSASEGGSCTRFGCKNGLTKVADDGFVQFVDNPHPSFFDISHIGRPADPIAYGFGADYLEKAAALDYVPGGAELAEMYGQTSSMEVVLDSNSSPFAFKQAEVAYKLASAERDFEAKTYDEQDHALTQALRLGMAADFDLAPLGKAGTADFREGLSALASEDVVLSPRDFVRLIRGQDAGYLEEKVAEQLPGIYGALVASKEFGRLVNSNPFRPGDGYPSRAKRDWAIKCAAAHSLHPERVRMRASLSALRQTEQPCVIRHAKTAEARNGEAFKLAGLYALYKLAYLASKEDSDRNLPLTCELAIRQNYA